MFLFADSPLLRLCFRVQLCIFTLNHPSVCLVLVRKAREQMEQPVTDPVFEAAAAGCHRDFTEDYRAEPSPPSFVQLSAFPQPQTLHRWAGIQRRGCHSRMQVCIGVQESFTYIRLSGGIRLDTVHVANKSLIPLER